MDTPQKPSAPGTLGLSPQPYAALDACGQAQGSSTASVPNPGWPPAPGPQVPAKVWREWAELIKIEHTVFALPFALSGLVLLWVATRVSRKRYGADALFLAIAASAVVSYHLYIHDMSVLLIPVAVTLNEYIGAEAAGDRCGRLIARASALMFAAPACMSFIPFHFYLVSLPLLAFLFAIAAASRDYAIVRGSSGRSAAFLQPRS